MARNKASKAKASKSRGPSRAGPVERRLPDWYYRVNELVTHREFEKRSEWSESEPHPDDFDEDISELGSENDSECHCYPDVPECECKCSCPSDASECECECECECPPETPECDCGNPDLDEVLHSDEESYHEYKDMRERRKKEIAARRKVIDDAIGYHKAQEEEVEKAWTRAKSETQSTKESQLNLKSAHFTMYASEYIRLLPLFHRQGTMYIEFYPACVVDNSLDTMLSTGHIYFDGCTSHDLRPFRAPRHTGLSSVDIGIQNSDARVTVTFINHYSVKVSIPRHLVPKQPPSSGSSDSLEFCGVSFELEEKKKRKREGEGKTERKRRHQRETSPRESWFEMNHPMGSWAEF